MAQYFSLSIFHRFLGAVSRTLSPEMRARAAQMPVLGHALRFLVARFSPAERVPVKVQAGLLEGLIMKLNLRLERGLWLGSYETAIQTAIIRYLRPGVVVYDVGGHIGYLSMGMARLVGPSGRVLVFEPLPDNVGRIREQMALNPSLRVELHEFAVSDCSGRAVFSVHASASMGQLRDMDGRFLSTIEVETVSLDDFVYKHAMPAPDFIKMDIEGAEALAFPGMLRLLHEKAPRILLELHGGAEKPVWETLQKAGYKLISLATNEELKEATFLCYGHYLAERL